MQLDTTPKQIDIFFLLFQNLKNYTLKKKIDEHDFLSYTKHYLSTKKLGPDDDAYLGWGSSKI